jgi:predicted nucleic acid-binding protein
MKALLDVNIIIDIAESRNRVDDTLKIINGFGHLLISTNTFTTAFYLLRKIVEKDEIYKLLNEFELLEITPYDCHNGFTFAKSTDDVEDCVEISLAIRNKIPFITADKKLVKRYGDLNKIVLVA